MEIKILTPEELLVELTKKISPSSHHMMRWAALHIAALQRKPFVVKADDEANAKKIKAHRVQTRTVSRVYDWTSYRVGLEVFFIPPAFGVSDPDEDLE